MDYKRMMEIDPSRESALLARKTTAIDIRPSKRGDPNVWVVETNDPGKRRAVDRIVDEFAID